MADWTLPYKPPQAPNPQGAALMAIQAAGQPHAGAAIDVAARYMDKWSDTRQRASMAREQRRDLYGIQSQLQREKYALAGQVQQQKLQAEQQAEAAQRARLQQVGSWAASARSMKGVVEKVKTTPLEEQGNAHLLKGSDELRQHIIKTFGIVDDEGIASAEQTLTTAVEVPMFPSEDVPGRILSALQGSGLSSSQVSAILSENFGDVARNRLEVRERVRRMVGSSMGPAIPTPFQGAVGGLPKDVSAAAALDLGSVEPFELHGDAGLGVLKDVFGAAELSRIAGGLGGAPDPNALMFHALGGSNRTQFVISGDGQVAVESTNAQVASELNELLANPPSQAAAMGIITGRGALPKSEGRRVGSARTQQAAPEVSAPEPDTGIELEPEPEGSGPLPMFATGGMLDFIE